MYRVSVYLDNILPRRMVNMQGFGSSLFHRGLLGGCGLLGSGGLLGGTGLGHSGRLGTGRGLLSDSRGHWCRGGKRGWKRGRHWLSRY